MVNPSVSELYYKLHFHSVLRPGNRRMHYNTMVLIETHSTLVYTHTYSSYTIRSHLTLTLLLHHTTSVFYKVNHV